MAFLDQADAARLTDHPRFAAMLARFHAEAPPLNESLAWRVRYLDAWEASFRGEGTVAETLLRDIIDHSGHPGLIAKAQGLLMSNLSLSRRYAEAFELANQVAGTIDTVHDPEARAALLANLSQTLNFAGERNLAVRYARMVSGLVPGAMGECRALVMELAARYDDPALDPDGPEVNQGLARCTAAGQSVLRMTIVLIRTDLYLQRQRPADALALLDEAAPDIARNGYIQHTVSAMTQRATAYEQLHRDADARRVALASLKLGDPSQLDSYLRDAYKVLYEVEKRAGHAAVALQYYQAYGLQERGYRDDMTARSLAYETAQSRALIEKMEAEKLARENHVLKLQSELGSRALETSRLSIALLCSFIFFILLWLIRVRRSQQRFRHLSQYDGLTHAFNHQHFMASCGEVLASLGRDQGVACVVLLDLDHFKTVNDTHGHAVGDVVLKHAVATCRNQLQPGDVLGRLGGEEFGILLRGCHEPQGLARADAIRAAMEATPVVIDGRTVAYTISVGVACTRDHGYDIQALLQQADLALYAAKRGGRNRVVSSREAA